MIEVAISKKLNGPMGEMKLSLDFTVESNQITVIYGPSGAGKTTLLNIISGLIKPDAGRITKNGKIWLDTEKKNVIPPQERKIAYVFQDYALFPNMSVENNIRYAAQKNTSDAKIKEIIEIFELQDLKNQKPFKLSGGQQQRVALARALIQKPDLLLLDEPLSALDNKIRLHLQDYILEIQDRYELTTLLVSHDIAEIHKLAKHVLILQNGIIVKAGKPIDVFTEEKPLSSFNSQARIIFIDKEKLEVTALANHENLTIKVSKEKIETLNVGDYILLSFPLENVKLFPINHVF